MTTNLRSCSMMLRQKYKLRVVPLKAQTLGATEERAQMLYDAAQQMQQTQGKTPKELSDMIADNFEILMQLEMVAARGEGGAMGGPPAGEMPPAGPEGMPAPPMMPPEGM